jgi:putative cell wall-binding protein
VALRFTVVALMCALVVLLTCATALAVVSPMQVSTDFNGVWAPLVSGDRVVWWGGGDDLHGEPTVTIRTWAAGPGAPIMVPDAQIQPDWLDVSGERLAWQTAGQLLTWRAGEAHPTTVTSDGGDHANPALSGDRLVWDTGGWAVCTLKVGDSQPTTLDSTPGDGVKSRPAVSGDRVVWLSNGPGGLALRTWKAGDSEASTLTTAVDWATGTPCVSGDRVAWLVEGDGQVRTMMVGESTPTVVTSGPSADSALCLSGDRLAWYRNSGGKMWAMTWRVGDARPTTIGPGASGGPDTMPDVSGDRVVWCNSVSGAVHVCTWRAGDSTMTVLGDGRAPRVSGDRVVWKAYDLRPGSAYRYQVFTFLVPPAATWSPTYAHVRNVGSSALANGGLSSARSIAVDKWGYIFVGSKVTDRVVEYTPEASMTAVVGTLGAGEGQFTDPVAIDVDRWGDVYVADRSTTSRVEIFDSDLTFLDEFDGSSGGYGMDGINGIAVALDGTIYTSHDGGTIQRWSRSGARLGSWDTSDRPVAGIAVDQDGVVYGVTRAKQDPSEVDTNRVVKYSATGTYLGAFGTSGTIPGRIADGSDVAVDGGGNVFVADRGGVTSNVDVFRSNGAVRSAFGFPGNAANQLGWPKAVATGFDRKVAVADTNNDRASVWSGIAAATTTEVAGRTQIDTAIAASKRAYPNGANAVVLTTGYGWYDALGGAALAGTVKGPMLLVGHAADPLPTSVRNEIIRLGAKQAYLLGGLGAIGQPVEDSMKSLLGATHVTRLGGRTLYDTAAYIANKVVDLRGADYDGVAILATSRTYADALSASPVAAANGWPVYLTPGTALGAAAKTSMVHNGVSYVVVVGGPGAVRESVLTNEVGTAPVNADYERVWGDDQYDTSAEIAATAVDFYGLVWSRPLLATGEKYADALSCGVLQGTDYSPVLLTRSHSLPASTTDVLKFYKNEIYELRFGGGIGVVGPEVRTAATALMLK